MGRRSEAVGASQPITATVVAVIALCGTVVSLQQTLVAGYGIDVDLDVIRGWWSLRSLRASRRTRARLPRPFHRIG